MFTYDYAMPSVTVDVVAVAFIDKVAHMLLIKRGAEPFAGYWALPGGFAEPEERLEAAAARELQEETGVFIPDIDPHALLGVYSTPGRDPRGWVISTAYALYVPEVGAPKAGDDAAEAEWVPVRELGLLDLAFDHRDMIEAGLRHFGLAFPQ